MLDFPISLDPENVSIAVGISLISCLFAEIHAFEVYRPPSWICSLPVWSCSFSTNPSGMLGLKNVNLAFGISLVSFFLSCLEVEIHAFEV